MQLELLRLALLARSQASLFERRKADGSIPNREEWLREVFSEPIAFNHRGAAFHFVPDETPDRRFIAGRLGRQLIVSENEPPESGLQEMRRETWKAVVVLIDPRPHDDGQKAAVGLDSRIGKPIALFRSLASHLNTREPPEPYVIEANGIIDPETFWTFVRENEGRVTSVTFELVAPNMFGQRDDLDREMRDLREHERARRVAFSLQNEEGLSLDTERIRQTASYAAEGGGTIKAIAKGHRYFSSHNRTKRVIVHGEPEWTEPELTLIQRAVKWAFGT